MRRPLESIQSGIAIAFSVLILCTTAVIGFNSYRLTRDAVSGTSLEYTRQLIDQVRYQVQSYLDNMESVLVMFMHHEELRKLASMPEPNRPEGIGLRERIGRTFRMVAGSREDIASIVFVGRNGAIVSDQPSGRFRPYRELIEQDWYRKALASDGVVVSSSRIQRIYRREYRWVVSVSRAIAGEGEAAEPAGVLLVDLNFRVIESMLDQLDLGKQGYVFLVDAGGDLVYHPHQQLIHSRLKTEDFAAIMRAADGGHVTDRLRDGKWYVVSSTTFGWKAVGVIHSGELVANERQLQLTAAAWCLLLVIAAILLSVAMARRLTSPIKQLQTHMKEVEKGNFDIRVRIESQNEIGRLARAFNLMIAKIKELMEQVVAEQEQKRTSELKALQSQITPHFLYNTLDSIIWMAEVGKNAEVVRMTTALSRLLRFTTGKGGELVPLSEELAHAESYLTIQQIRYRNRFSWELDVAPDAMDCKVQRVILQPLLENAIYHGIREKPDPGMIRVSGRREGGVLVLEVEDDGVGMDRPVKLDGWPEGAADGALPSGVGLANVHRRIRLAFGAGYGIRLLESEPDEGTRVVLHLPALDGRGDPQ
jgi:two-component system sensor histidine kinase YesM